MKKNTISLSDEDIFNHKELNPVYKSILKNNKAAFNSLVERFQKKIIIIIHGGIARHQPEIFIYLMHIKTSPSVYYYIKLRIKNILIKWIKF